MERNGNRLHQKLLKQPQLQQYSPNNSTLHITDDLRPHPRVDRSRTEAQGGTDASVVKADEGKQKQHAECVDNTGATQLSKLSDINLSCAPEQDLGLKSLDIIFNSEFMPQSLSSTVWPWHVLANRAGT